MAIYTSRFSNPELKSCKYTAIQISTGKPRWKLGYPLSGEIKSLAPYGVFNKFTGDEFNAEYIKRLESYGVNKIMNDLQKYGDCGKDVVLLCFEDITKPGQTCHRAIFSDWWLKKTGVKITELYDPSHDDINGSPNKNDAQGKPGQLSLL